MGRRSTTTRADQLRDYINKALGGSVVVSGSSPSLKVKYLPVSLPLDIVMQGGLPRGRMVEMTGNYSTLKSYFGLLAIKEEQKRGGLCALIDTEHAYDPDWAKQIGVNTDELLLWPNPDDDSGYTGEEAIDVANFFVTNRVDLIVFDSVAATLPQQEATKRLHKENVQPGRLADLMSRGLRKLTAANKNTTAILWINQLREQIGITFGPTEKASGGRALGYYASIRLNIRKAGKLTRDIKSFTGDKFSSSKQEIGQTFRVVIEKNKLNRPGMEVYFDFRLEDPVGIDEAKFLFTQGVQLGLVEQRNKTWIYNGTKAVGKDAFVRLVRTNDDVRESLETEVREAWGLPTLSGDRVRAKKKATGSSAKSLPKKASGNTRGQARAGSGSTVRIRRKLLR